MTPDRGQHTRAAARALAPTLAATLRRIALHQETAALLEQRALRATPAEAADSLRRRAAAHARQAQQLRAALAAARHRSTARVPLAGEEG